MTMSQGTIRRIALFVMIVAPIVVLGTWAPAAASSKDVAIQEPDRAFLGIRMKAGSGVGISVASVISGSAADRAGIKAGDVIVGIGPHQVRYPNQLLDRLADMRPGDPVDVAVLRGGGEERLYVELGQRAGRTKIDLDGAFTMVSPRKRGQVEGTIHVDRPDDLKTIFLCREDYCRFSGNDRIWYRADCIGRGCRTFEIDYYGRPMLGVQLAGKEKLLEQYPEGDVSGLMVAEVFTGSPAEEAGIEAGDVIVSVDGDAIASAGDLRRKLDELADANGGAMEADILRNGTEERIRVYMPDRSRSRR